MKYHFGDKLLRFWDEDRSLSVFLTLLIVVVFVLPVFGREGPLGALFTDILLSALLVAGALNLPGRRWARWCVPPGVAVALLLRWVNSVAASVDLAMWSDLSTLATLLLFTTVVAGQVFRSGPVTRHRILGAVAVYLLLGLGWAHAYAILHRIHPGAFAGNFGDAFALETWIYYSFVTLTTTGYGDIMPVYPVARSLAIAEALTGQLYIAITLARLVALHTGAQEKR